MGKRRVVVRVDEEEEERLRKEERGGKWGRANGGERGARKGRVQCVRHVRVFVWWAGRERIGDTERMWKRLRCSGNTSAGFEDTGWMVRGMLHSFPVIGLDPGPSPDAAGTDTGASWREERGRGTEEQEMCAVSPSREVCYRRRPPSGTRQRGVGEPAMWNAYER